MNDTFISFYLKANRIHVFVEALRGIGSPSYVTFLLDRDCNFLVLAPYDKKDFHSHRVPSTVYQGKNSLELCSIRLCNMLTFLNQWAAGKSYRVRGKIITQQKIAVFDLKDAEIIEH